MANTFSLDSSRPCSTDCDELSCFKKPAKPVEVYQFLDFNLTGPVWTKQIIYPSRCQTICTTKCTGDDKVAQANSACGACLDEKQKCSPRRNRLGLELDQLQPPYYVQVCQNQTRPTKNCIKPCCGNGKTK